MKNLTPDIFYFTHDLPPSWTRESPILPLLNFVVGTCGRYFCRAFSIESSVFQRNRPMTYQEMFCLVTVLAARAALDDGDDDNKKATGFTVRKQKL